MGHEGAISKHLGCKMSSVGTCCLGSCPTITYHVCGRDSGGGEGQRHCLREQDTATSVSMAVPRARDTSCHSPISQQGWHPAAGGDRSLSLSAALPPLCTSCDDSPDMQ